MACGVRSRKGRDRNSSLDLQPATYTFLHPSPIPAPHAGLREGPTDSLADRVFDNAINVAIAASRDAYERMAFREALKAAAYDLGNARDVYRWAQPARALRVGYVVLSVGYTAFARM